jgi:hypothetical protein
MALSDGAGWNGDAAAGCPAVVVVDGAGAVAAGAGAGGGGGGVAGRPAGAGLAVRTRGRGGRATVTVGRAAAGASCGAACGASGLVCGASGVVCDGCGAGAGDSDGAAGVSDAGGTVVCGAAGGAGGVCEDAAPAKQSAISAELLRRRNRLVRMDMTTPQSPDGNEPSAPNDRRGKMAPRGGIGAVPAHARSQRYPQIDVRREAARARRAGNNVGPLDQMRGVPPRAARG